MTPGRQRHPIPLGEHTAWRAFLNLKGCKPAELDAAVDPVPRPPAQAVESSLTGGFKDPSQGQLTDSIVSREASPMARKDLIPLARAYQGSSRA